MPEFQAFPGAALDRCGLNRQHVFKLADLPPQVSATLGDTAPFRQLILVGHGGKALWECVKAARMVGADPIDDYSIQTIDRCFAEYLPANRYRIVFPGDQPVALQQLGKLAGWHHAAPFMVGIDPIWGSWYAYRAVVLADTNFCPFLTVNRNRPCDSCQTRPCIAACPAGAMNDGGFALDKCIAYRKRDDSACHHTCLARAACPVGSEHRYDDDQMRHSYSISLAMIRQHF
jgi:hypothetical protein